MSERNIFGEEEFSEAIRTKAADIANRLREEMLELEEMIAAETGSKEIGICFNASRKEIHIEASAKIGVMEYAMPLWRGNNHCWNLNTYIPPREERRWRNRR